MSPDLWLWIGFLCAWAIGLGVYNGLIVRWGADLAQGTDPRRAKVSKQWHAVGALIKIYPLLGPLYYLWGDLLAWALILSYFIPAAWAGYNMALNITRTGVGVFYTGSKSSGTGSVIDRLLSGAAIWWINLILLIWAVIFTLLIYTNIL